MYDSPSAVDVIAKFRELVQRYLDSEKIPADCEYPFKAVAWRKDALREFFPAYKEEAVPHKVHWGSLIDYLSFGGITARGECGLAEIHSGIASALMHLLSVEEIDVGRLCAEGASRHRSRYRRLASYLAEHHPSLHEELVTGMYHWSLKVYRGKIAEVHGDIAAFVPTLLTAFGKRVHKSQGFVEATSSSGELPDGRARSSNTFCASNGLKVEVCTVHSVKGEDHTATLYLESSYHRKYEIEYVEPSFRGEFVDLASVVAGPNTDEERAKQCAKVLYVGFSRPTHLLCYAVHKDMFRRETFKANWEIVDYLVADTAGKTGHLPFD